MAVEQPHNRTLQPLSDMGHIRGPARPQPTRTDTGSSVGSTRGRPFDVCAMFCDQRYTGNCPRCHHFHDAVPVTTLFNGDATGVSYLSCQKCGRKMATFGYGNEDNISLLSTQTTTELDPVEQSFRQALARMVRSATAIATPTVLPSVPEDPLSREPSTRSRNAEPGVSLARVERDASRPPLPRPRHSRTASPTPNQLNQSTSHAVENVAPHLLQKMPPKDRGMKVRLRKIADSLVSLPSRLKRNRSARETMEIQPPVVERHLPDEEYHRNASPRNETHGNSHSSLPAIGEPAAGQLNCTTSSQLDGANGLILPSEVDMIRLGLMPSEHCIDWFQEQFPADCKEKVRQMDKDQRAAWIRAQYTAFRKRYVERPQRRHTQLSLTPSYADSPRNSFASALRRPERSHSADFSLIAMGTHMDPNPFGAGEFFHENRPFTISSTTNLSQAPTEVPSTRTSIISAVPSMGTNFQHHLGPRSRSRPRSVASRLRSPISRDDTARRSSIDSIASIAASRGLTGLAVHTDGESVISLRSIVPPGDTAPIITSRDSAP